MHNLDCKESSNPRWARWDEATRRLEVDFQKDGVKVSTYEYDNFPAEAWLQFLRATDKSRYFAFVVRPRYEKSKAYRKIWDRRQVGADSPGQPGLL